MTVLLHELLILWLIALCAGQAPGTPSGLAMTDSTETSLTISWNAGANAARYVVSWEAKRPFSTNVLEEVVDARIRIYRINDLAEGTTYTISVASMNEAGTLSSTISRDYTTDSTAPSSAPTALGVSALSETTLRLSWRAPAIQDWNSLSLTTFVYCLTETTVSNSKRVCNTVSSSVSSNNDENFEYSNEVTVSPISEYLVSVYARNAQGNSPYSREISVTTPGNENGYFQVAFRSFFNCQEWIKNYESSSSSFFSDLIYYIRTNCDCNFIGNGGGIDSEQLSCRNGDTNSVVIRARLVASSDIALSSLMLLIDDWKVSSQSAVVAGQRLDIDVGCPTAVGNLNAMDCYNPAGAIAGGIIGALVVVVIAVLAVVLAVVLVKKFSGLGGRKRSSHLSVRKPATAVDSVVYSRPVQSGYDVPIQDRTEGETVSAADYETMQSSGVDNHNRHMVSSALPAPRQYETPQLHASGDSFENNTALSDIQGHYEIDEDPKRRS